MDTIPQRIIANNFLELPGLKVHAIIPVPEGLVNEILGATLKGNKDIKSCRISIDREYRISMSLKIHFWPWPLNIKLKLLPEIDFSGVPKVRAFMENKKMLGKLGAFF